MARLFDITIGQDHEFKLALQNAGMTLEEAVQVGTNPQLAAKMVAALRLGLPMRYYPTRDFSRYDQYLRPLSEQLEVLRDLNQRMPSELRVSDAWLDLDTASDHVQGVEDLETFFVSFDLLEPTWAFSQELVRLTQPAIYDSGFRKDATNMQLHSTARRHPPGIHRVRINLVDNWDPENGRNTNQVRERAGSKQLGAVEPVGAYGLQDPRLYQSQDGENLPYFDCAGIEQGDGFRLVPYSHWYRIFRSVCFGAYSADGVNSYCAAPSLV